MRVDEKQKIADDVRARFLKSDAVILVDYKGLDVQSLNLLRSKLRGVDVEFQVVKNSLLTRASAGSSVELVKDNFKGPSAVVFCYGDPVAPAKVLTDFSQENGNLKVKVGVLGEKVISSEDIKTLASLPSREALIAQLLSTMNAVPVSLVTVLNGITRNFMNVLKALKGLKS